MLQPRLSRTQTEIRLTRHRRYCRCDTIGIHRARGAMIKAIVYRVIAVIKIITNVETRKNLQPVLPVSAKWALEDSDLRASTSLRSD